MKSATIALLGVVLVVSAIGGIIFWTQLAEKKEWAILQSIESLYRSAPYSREPRLVRAALGTEFDLLGFPALHSKYKFVWIILNPGIMGQKVKLIPSDVSFLLKCGALQAIKSHSNKKVVKYLSEHCLQ